MSATANDMTTKRPAAAALLNLPNQLTVARLVLSLVLFGFIGFGWYGTSLVLFLIAAGTDWLDGYFARKYGLITVLGRILDPFADKVIICGSLIFLVAIPNSGLHELGLRAWLVVLVVGRELLITGLRSFLEQQGADFSAAMSGKLKMVAQCALVGCGLGYLGWPTISGSGAAAPQALAVAVEVSVWATAVLTAYSGIVYVLAAIRLLR
ncbi:MAG TPA: CDP-diacylglycerol--glycerol-3-phosphate 3-phosphatidyltransferase [Pirellulales bacterium]|jgi:CDP-diacylglycerol--glycerol-3-phosphate 3-phosphatidyltransferase|nr:CDP-diacylglycerol--glycerol-3-phosphate 3-phosphatidyltransferase [Pirellulales bacterium]